jgi:DNA-binding GntR family transcriptional regulator
MHDEVADRLRALILSGELEPLARLNELELGARFGTSRTPLREALKILSAEGVVELLPNRGARVASLSASEIDDMLRVVAALEALAAKLACDRAGEEEIDAIAGDTAAMRAAFARRDDAAYFTLNRAIHEAIMAAARNAPLSSTYLALSSRVQRMRYTAHKTEAQWLRAMEEHEEMLELLRARDGAMLSLLMERHILGKAEVIAASYGGPPFNSRSGSND